ncbi:hypothetical protein [Litorivivens sp.]|uniref:hypothetical protein n=1 Tax=Litorivivens sp. TaxID=2020868 RepID=UPI003568D50B
MSRGCYLTDENGCYIVTDAGCRIRIGDAKGGGRDRLHDDTIREDNDEIMVIIAAFLETV